MKIKICGIFRDEDVDYINEARPDYSGFVFAQSRREVSPAQAARLRRRFADGIAAVDVFVNSPGGDIAALYRDRVISLAQLHGSEDEAYIARLKEESLKSGQGSGGLTPIPVIKVVKSGELEMMAESRRYPESKNFTTEFHGEIEKIPSSADYFLIDSGAGSGKTFDWSLLSPGGFCAAWLKSSGKPWFLAGGITLDNIEAAMAFRPFCIDVSGGAETNGVKDREKIVQLTAMVRKDT
jgi:phosphoribosylanthranilate isomerase